MTSRPTGRVAGVAQREPPENGDGSIGFPTALSRGIRSDEGRHTKLFLAQPRERFDDRTSNILTPIPLSVNPTSSDRLH
jgi:hypothetical protein